MLYRSQLERDLRHPRERKLASATHPPGEMACKVRGYELLPSELEIGFQPTLSDDVARRTVRKRERSSIPLGMAPARSR